MILLFPRRWSMIPSPGVAVPTGTDSNLINTTAFTGSILSVTYTGPTRTTESR